MINNAKLDFQFIRSSILDELNGDLVSTGDLYKRVISAITTLNKYPEEFCIVIQVTKSPQLSKNEHGLKLGAIIKGCLTRRELEVYALAMRGLSNRMIAEKLFVTIETVKSHRKSIVRKAGVKRMEDIKNHILEANGLIE